MDKRPADDLMLDACHFFVCDWACVVQARVGSFSVIEDLDVFEDFASGLILVDETAVVDQLVLQVGEKAFHNSVVSWMSPL